MRSWARRKPCLSRPGLMAAAALACTALWPAAAFAQLQEGAAQDIPAPPADISLPEVETVIDDEEFESLVPEFDPDVDPELDRPLESIEEFESRLARERGEEVAAEGDRDAPSGLSAGSLADGTTEEAIPDAPIRDSELLAPLTPLESYRYEPDAYAAAQSGEDDAQLEYGIEITGLEEADRQSDGDIRGLFNELSALRAGDGRAANLSQVYARLDEDKALMQTVLASEGWYEARTFSRIANPGEADAARPVALLEVVPGQRYSFAKVTVEPAPTVPPELIADNFPLEAGQPIVADRVQGAEARLAVALPRNGYPFAELGQRDILLDRETGQGDYTLPLDVGPRSRFGEIVSRGDEAFDAEHISVIARFERGDLYDSRYLDDLRKALIATGLFSAVSAVPERTGEDAGDGSEYANILVEQQAGPPRTIAARAGYGTGEGFRVEGSWTHRNLFPPEGALILKGVAGTKEQGVGATFRRSNAGRRDRTFQLSADLLHSDYAALDGYTARLAGLISYDSTPIWQKRLTYAFGGQLMLTSEEDYDFDLGARDRRTFFIAGLTGQLGFDTSDDLLDPTEGFRLTALVEPEGGLDGGFHPYVRTRIDGSAYLPVGDSLVVAGRVRLGTIQGVERFDLAPSRRFYAGGGGSVRGFPYQALGPQDQDGDPIGGRSLFEAAAEVRYRFGDFGVVGFVDAGQAYAETLPQFSDLRMGAGIGGRYYTNFGPMRLDIATPLDRREGESWISVYISIGQAF